MKLNLSEKISSELKHFTPTLIMSAKSGLIGPIRYLWLFRWIISLGIVMRFYIHKSQLSPNVWVLFLGLATIVIILALLATYITYRKDLRHSKQIQVLFVGADIVLISAFYYLTENVESDFFLFYYLPIFIATEYLHRRGIITVFTCITLAFLSVLTLIYINFPRDHFTFQDLILRVFLPRQFFFFGFAALSSYLQIVSRAQKERTLLISGFQNFIQSLATSFTLSQVLEDIAANMLKVLGADNVTLYEYFENNDEIKFPPIMQGTFRDRDSMFARVYSNKLLRRLLRSGETIFLSDVYAQRLFSENRSSMPTGSPRFVSREGIKSTAALVLKTEGPKEIVGIMFVNFRLQQHFETEQKLTMNILASSAAIAIRNARLYRKVRRDLAKREKELTTLKSIDQAIVSSTSPPGRQFLLELILDKMLEITKAPYGNIYWFNKWESMLELRAEKGAWSTNFIKLKIGEGIVGYAALKQKSIIVYDVDDKWESFSHEILPGIRSILSVPLFDEGGLLCVLSVEHTKKNVFSENERALLETLSTQLAIGVHTIDLCARIERQALPMDALNLITTRIRDPRYDLDTILRLILTGITASSGLAFSRAMLFLTNEESTNLQGILAIGPKSQKEANETWRLINESKENFTGDKKTELDLTLETAEKFSIAVKAKNVKDSPLSEAIKETSVPIGDWPEALPRARLWQTGVVKDNTDDCLRKVIEKVTVSEEKRSFACVSLMGRGNPIGILIVDNHFLFPGKEIGEADIKSLEAYARFIALSIENLRLQTRLTEEHKRETWNSFARNTMHVFGKRLTLISGRVTILRDCLSKIEQPGNRTEDPFEYLKQINEDISNADKILEEFLEFAKPKELKLERIDLVTLLDKVCRDIKPGVKCEISSELAGGSFNVQGDFDMLSNAFYEIIINADEAMREYSNGSPKIDIAGTIETVSTPPGKFIRIDFKDTGKGFSEENNRSLFDPFFTTKRDGHGLGLSIVKKAIEQHGGEINAVCEPMTGTCFRIFLPFSE